MSGPKLERLRAEAREKGKRIRELERPAAPDFVRRGFTAEEPDLVRVGDMTEIDHSVCDCKSPIGYEREYRAGLTVRLAAQEGLHVSRGLTDAIAFPLNLCVIVLVLRETSRRRRRRAAQPTY